MDELRKRQLLARPKVDRYTRQGTLIQRAYEGETEVDRMVGAVRLVLAICSDILRPSNLYEQTPVVLLGQHTLTRRDLPAPAPGDPAVTLRVQEIANFKDEEMMPYARQGEFYNTGDVLAYLEITGLQPEAKTKAKLLSTKLEVRLSEIGHAVLEMPGRGERYTITLPSLKITDPLSSAASIDFTGQATVKCEETKTLATLTFKELSKVKGSIEHVEGSKCTKVLSIKGSWDDEVLCSRIAVGQGMDSLLFDCNGYAPPADDGPGGVLKVIDLNSIGAMEIPKLWSAIHDALTSVDENNRSLLGGDKAAALAKTLNTQLGALSLENNAPKPRPTSLTANLPKERPELPPCIAAVKAQGKRLKWTLGLWVCAPPPEKEEAPPPEAGPEKMRLTREQKGKAKV